MPVIKWAFQKPLSSPRIVIRFLPAVDNDMMKCSFAEWVICFATHGLPLNDVEFPLVLEKIWTEWKAFNVKPAPSKEPSEVVSIPRSIPDEERNLEWVHSEIAGHAIGEAGINFLVAF